MTGFSQHFEKTVELLSGDDINSYLVPHFNNFAGVSPYEGFLIVPASGSDLPLVLFPHGGPHGVSLAS